jgi:drug/metabolite transporter (DMT)-like permease
VALYPLIIVFGALIAIVFLGERPQPFHLVGTLLIVCGVLRAARPKKSGAMPTARPRESGDPALLDSSLRGNEGREN